MQQKIRGATIQKQILHSLLFPLHFSSFTSLVEEVEFICENWVDPESIGIKSYLLFSTDVTTNVKNTI